MYPSAHISAEIADDAFTVVTKILQGIELLPEEIFVHHVKTIDQLMAEDVNRIFDVVVVRLLEGYL